MPVARTGITVWGFVLKKHPIHRRPLFCALLSLALALPALAAEPAGQAPTPVAAPVPPVASTTPVVPPATNERLTAADLEAWVDGFMPYALEQTDVAGSVVVVVKDGKVLLQKGYGYSDLATRKPVDPASTLFRPGSVSKLFTWTAVMQLVEQGKIDLDKDINAYLDFEIPPYNGKPVTMRNIMTHTTGFEETVRHLIHDDPQTGVVERGDHAAEL